MGTKTLWIGLVGLRPRAGNDSLGDARGAFVHVLTLATDEDDYVRQMHLALDEFQFDFDQVCDVEPYSVLVEREGKNGALDQVAQKVSADGYSRFGEFFLYERDDA